MCAAIYELQSWPDWWLSVKSVEQIAESKVDGTGGCYRFAWRGALPYRLDFAMQVTRFIPSCLIEGRVTGDVNGLGTWYLSSNGKTTSVLYEWNVSICNRMIRFLAYIASPIVRWNHNFVMHQGGLSLARLLNADLVKIEHS